MHVLVADDEAVFRNLLQQFLKHWGHSVTTAANGEEAWDVLVQPEPPTLAMLDWMMPRLDGPELCRRIRTMDETKATYVILVTARRDRGDIVTGLKAGADDYVIKPFDSEELRARVAVGERVISLQNTLNTRISELQHALAQVHTLQGLIPICAYCKRVRNEREYWERVESYIAARSDARFSHGVCPECSQRLNPDFLL
ncbi:MAG: response regulator [Longimicrobiales bacterium]